MKTTIFITLFGFCSLHSRPDASNWDAPRNFHEDIHSEFIERIKIEQTEKVIEHSAGKIYSSNQSYWFQIFDSRDELYEVSISSDRELFLVSLKRPYKNFPVSVKWINEKLVFIRVYWGRIQGSDLIFDSEKGRLIYHETVIDGKILYEQTKQAENR